MVTVQVIYESDGKPAKNKRVAIGCNEFFALGITKDIWTDNNGEAHFDRDPTDKGVIYVDSKTVHQGRVAGRVVVYI